MVWIVLPVTVLTRIASLCVMVLTPLLYIPRSIIKTGHYKCFNEVIPYSLSYVGLPDHVVLMPNQLSAICLVCGAKVVFLQLLTEFGESMCYEVLLSLFDCTSGGESWVV